MRSPFTIVVYLIAAVSLIMLLSVSVYYNHAPLSVHSPFKMWCPFLQPRLVPDVRGQGQALGLQSVSRGIFDLIRDYCGDVCNTTIGPLGRGKYYDVVEKNIDCDRFFSNDFIEGWEQPKDIDPPDLEYLISVGGESYYSYQGRVNIKSDYWNGKSATKSTKTWTKKMFEEQRALFRKKMLPGTYGTRIVLEVEYLMRKSMIEHVIGGRALVIGSEGHWQTM